MEHDGRRSEHPPSCVINRKRHSVAATSNSIKKQHFSDVLPPVPLINKRNLFKRASGRITHPNHCLGEIFLTLCSVVKSEAFCRWPNLNLIKGGIVDVQKDYFPPSFLFAPLKFAVPSLTVTFPQSDLFGSF